MLRRILRSDRTNDPFAKGGGKAFKATAISPGTEEELSENGGEDGKHEGYSRE